MSAYNKKPAPTVTPAAHKVVHDGKLPPGVAKPGFLGKGGMPAGSGSGKDVG